MAFRADPFQELFQGIEASLKRIIVQPEQHVNIGQISINLTSSLISAFSCAKCLEPFRKTFKSDDEADQRPRKLCSNNHYVCVRCSADLNFCPFCDTESLDPASICQATIDFISEGRKIIENQIPDIPYDELEFVSKTEIGEGSFSKVFQCRWKNIDVAFKKLKCRPESEELENMRREAVIGRLLRHTNIVQFYGISTTDKGRIGFVMELADQGTLRKKMKTLTLKQKIKICLCICNGLAHLHANRVAHRDLKPENILLFGESLIAKISDFGTSKVVQTMKSNTRVVGTAQYSAPELMEVGSTFGVSVDVYSMTVIFYELFSGRVPFSGTQMQVIRAKDQDKTPEIPDDFPPELTHLISLGWLKDPSRRPSIPEFKLVLINMIGDEKNSKEFVQLINDPSCPKSGERILPGPKLSRSTSDSSPPSSADAEIRSNFMSVAESFQNMINEEEDISEGARIFSNVFTSAMQNILRISPQN